MQTCVQGTGRGTPQKVKDMDQAEMIGGTLRRAGLRMEAQLLEESSDPASTAATIAAEFDSLPGELLEASYQGPLTSFAAYVRYAPNIEEIQRAVDSGAQAQNESRLAKLLFLARVAALYQEELNAAQVSERLSAFAQGIAELLADPSSTTADLALLRLYCACAMDSLEKLYGRGAFRRENNAAAPNTNHGGGVDLLLTIADRDLELAERLAREEGEASPAVFRTALTAYVETAKRMADLERPVRAYRHFVELYPDTEEAVNVLMELAELYRTALRAPAQAMSVYDEIVEKHPTSPQAVPAKVKKGVVLYDTERYADAYELLQVFLGEHGDSDQAVLAKFISACCEAALGTPDVAEQHMLELCEQHPQHSLAPAALYWVGSDHLSAQRYDKAVEVFKDLIARYPEARESAQARGYVDRLSKAAKKGE